MLEDGNKRLLKPKDVAKYVGLNISTVYKMLNEGTIPGKLFGERWRTRKDELEAFASGVVRSDDSGEGVQSATGNVRKI